MNITVEELAQRMLARRDDHRAAPGLAGEAGADAFEAFASGYESLVVVCTNCHIP